MDMVAGRAVAGVASAFCSPVSVEGKEQALLDMVAVGAASGVASAFCMPVGVWGTLAEEAAEPLTSVIGVSYNELTLSGMQRAVSVVIISDYNRAHLQRAPG
eukprot:scaffold18535_cov17-Tisochrysis_lutea.AAC.1